MAKKPTSPYRLIRGTHRVPRPDFVAPTEFEEGGDEIDGSHSLAQVGDVVHLTDEQFKSFKDKFRPISNDGTDVRDADALVLADAKTVAAATGQNIDPNKPIAAQIDKAKDPFANARVPATTS